jgi:hypothetical protein
MATPTIPNGEEYFFPVIYEGNGAGQRVGKFVPFTDNGTIANSVIYNRADSPKLARTPSSDGNRKTFTISVWYKPTDLGTDRTIIAADTSASGTGYAQFKLDSNNKLWFYSGTAGGGDVISTRTFEDSSKFYHFMAVVDTTQSTASNRVKFYVDGDLITSLDSTSYPSENGDLNFNSTSYPMAVGSFNSLTSLCAGGNLAEFNFVDGTALTPSTFGLTDTSTGRWIPKTLTGITYGTNGFRLTFADSSALGDDTSGNTNDFTATNLASTDQTTDSPTQNFSTLEASSSGSMTLSEGNLRYTTASSSNWESVYNDKSISSGKWYFELTCKVTTAYDAHPGVILESVLATNKNQLMGYSDGSVGYGMDGLQNVLYYGNSGNNYVSHTGTQIDAGDIVGVAYDADTGAMWFAKNNTWVNNGTGVGNPSTGANPTWVQGSFAGQKVRFGFSTYNASASSEVNFGQRSFTYTPPTGFVALQQDNLPETAKGVSGLVWTKNRDSTDNHQLYDSSRGKQKVIFPNVTNAESTVTDGLQKFLAGGQQIEDNDAINTAGESFVSWNWVANGSTASNSDGSITSTVQTNSDAGFSIVKWTGTGSNATVGHGLSTAPSFILGKVLTTTDNWIVGHHKLSSTSWNNAIFLNSNAAIYTSAAYWNNTAPTSSVFTTGTWWYSSQDYVAYCWHEVDGFSKFGTFSGSGSVDGPMIYTGFTPSFLLIKRTDSSTGGNWSIIDSTRYPTNPIAAPLLADTTDPESGLSSITMDLLSNGFKIRNTLNSNNASGGSYIFCAFASNPFVGDGTNPVTAR